MKEKPEYTLNQFRKAYYCVYGPRAKRGLQFAFLLHIEGIKLTDIAKMKELSKERTRQIILLGERVLNGIIHRDFHSVPTDNRIHYPPINDPESILSFKLFLKLNFKDANHMDRFKSVVEHIKDLPADKHRAMINIDHQQQQVIFPRKFDRMSFEAIRSLQVLINNGFTEA